jgi:hypothetical protein
MNSLYYLKERIRGWLPQEPQQPEKRANVNLVNPTAKAPIVIRVSGLLLSTVGVFLLAIVVFGALELSSSGFNLNQNLFPTSFVAGIALMVAGMTLSAHAEQFNGGFLRRPCLTVGLTLLTVSISAFLSEYLLATRMTAHQYGLLVTPYPTFFGFLASAGGLILFLGLSKWSTLPSLAKKSFCALAFGAATSLTTALFSQFKFYPPIPSLSLISVWGSPYLLFLSILNPVGIICLVLGWAGLFSISMKKRPFLLPSLFTLMLAIGIFLMSAIGILIPV